MSTLVTLPAVSSSVKAALEASVVTHNDSKRFLSQACFVLPSDQRFLRFLWWPEGDVTKEAQVYAMKVHLFGGKSSPSVVNFCMRKIADDNEMLPHNGS